MTGDPDLNGAKAIVTGGGRNIGARIARRLARAGAEVVICGRDESMLSRVCGEIASEGGRARYLGADVSTADGARAVVAEAVRESPGLDILVNNAGVAGPTAPLAEVTDQDWSRTIASNLDSVFLCSRAAIPHLRAGGTIVNLGSVTGKRPMVNRTPYASAKLGVVGLTRTLAHELGPRDITVNVISPFLVDGERTESVLGPMAAERGISPGEMRHEMTSETALGRAVPEEEVAAAVVYLASPGARSVTGQDLNLSAGAVMY